MADQRGGGDGSNDDGTNDPTTDQTIDLTPPPLGKPEPPAESIDPPWTHPFFAGLAFVHRANVERLEDVRFATNRLDSVIVQAADADTPTIIWNEVEDPDAVYDPMKRGRPMKRMPICAVVPISYFTVDPNE